MLTPSEKSGRYQFPQLFSAQNSVTYVMARRPPRNLNLIKFLPLFFPHRHVFLAPASG
jgi:hypothetical protein